MTILFSAVFAFFLPLFVGVPFASAEGGFSDYVLDSFSQGFFATLGSAFQTAFYWLLDGAILVIGYTAYTLFDGFLTIMSSALSAIGLASTFGGILSNIAGLPDGMVWLLNQVGFFPGLSIILSAIVARKVLDLIPGMATQF